MYREKRINIYYIMFGILALLSALFSIFVNKISPNVLVHASSSSQHYETLSGSVVVPIAGIEGTSTSVTFDSLGIDGSDITSETLYTISWVYPATQETRTATDVTLPYTMDTSIPIGSNTISCTQTMSLIQNGFQFDTTNVFVNITISSIKVVPEVHTLSIYSGINNENVEQMSLTKFDDTSSIDTSFANIDGYNIVGWYTDAELTNEYTFGTNITNDVSLYPKYEEITYTIKFYNVNSYSALGTLSYKSSYESIVWSAIRGLETTPTIDDVTGLTHCGWSLSKGLKSDSTNFIDIDTYIFTSDTVLYSVVTRNTYTATFLDAFGDTFKCVDYLYLSKISAVSEMPGVDGYEFKFWTDSREVYKNCFASSVYMKDNLTFYPVFKTLESNALRKVRLVNEGDIDYATNSSYVQNYLDYDTCFIGVYHGVVSRVCSCVTNYNPSNATFFVINDRDSIMSISEFNYSFNILSSSDGATYGDYFYKLYQSGTSKYCLDNFILPKYLDVYVSTLSNIEDICLATTTYSSYLPFSNYSVLENINITYVDGDNSETITYGLDETIEFPVLEDKEGYRFAGWSFYDESIGLMRYPLESSEVYKDSTLYAIWEKACTIEVQFYLTNIDNCIGSFSMSVYQNDVYDVDFIYNNFYELDFEYIRYVKLKYFAFELSDLVFYDDSGEAYLNKYTHLNEWGPKDDDIVYISCDYSYAVNFGRRKVSSEIYLECNLPFKITKHVYSSFSNKNYDLRKLNPYFTEDGFYMYEDALLYTFTPGFEDWQIFCIHNDDPSIVQMGPHMICYDYMMVFDYDDYFRDRVYVDYNLEFSDGVIILDLVYTPTRLVTLNYRTYYVDDTYKETYTIADVSITLPFHDGAEFNVEDFYNKAIFDVDLNTYVTDWHVDVEGKEFYDQINLFKFVGWDKELPTTITSDGVYTAIYETNKDMSQIKYYDKTGELIETKVGVIELINIGDLVVDTSLLDAYLECWRNFMLMRFGSVYNNFKDVFEFEAYYNSLSKAYVNTAYSRQTMKFSVSQICPQVKIDKVSNVQEFSCNIVSQSCIYVGGDYFDDDYVYVVNPFEKIYNPEDTHIYVTYGFILGTIVDVQDTINPGDDNIETTVNKYDEIVDKVEKFFDDLWNTLEDAWVWAKWIVLGIIILILINPITWILKTLYKLISGAFKAIGSLFTKDKKTTRKPNNSLYSKSTKRTRKK